MSFNEQPQVPPMPSAPQPASDMQHKLREFSDPKVKVGGFSVSSAAVTTVVAAFIAIIAMFLPYATVSVGGFISQTVSVLVGTNESGSFIKGDGWIVIVLAVVAAVLAVIRQALAAFVVAVLHFLLWLFETINAGRAVGEAASYSGLVQIKVSYGAGYWLWTVTVFVILIATGVEFYSMMQLKKAQGPQAAAAAAPPSVPPMAPADAAPTTQPGTPLAPYAQPMPPAPSAPSPQAPVSAMPPAPSAPSVTEVSQTDVYQVSDPSSPAGVDDVVVEQQTTYEGMPAQQSPAPQSPQSSQQQ
ncbi:hypothetical protein [Bifidobacterium castoris]|uniref:Large tegument protein n=1 Tax=Bifidobacterium castoris TaxID=2306972 RepID=A0A430F5A9_9BIFI|nr:hypothetical protein [Bifidobacterium castoris]RSX45162.1 hypothetical protein D2E22_1842 [Bifidobacterium castoris]